MCIRDSDYGDTEGSWTVVSYSPGETSTITTEANSLPMLNTESINKIELFDYDTNDLLETVEVFDPYKGLTINEVAQYIDFKQVVDPASYNITDLGEKDDYASLPWSSDHLGTLWWDLSEVRYIEYEQSNDIQYRASNWGSKFANSKVSIYEWAVTSVLPMLDESIDAKLDTTNSLAGQVRYSAATEIDPTTGVAVVKYYYWKKDATALPGNVSRPYSAASIEAVLNDPDANGVAWASPIATNALLLSNISGIFRSTDRVILRIEQNDTPEQIHTNSLLVTEGMNGDVINDFLFYRLSASIVGRDNYRETYKIKEYSAGTEYKRGDYVYVAANGQIVKTSEYSNADYPILRKHDDTRENIASIRTSLNGLDHLVYFVPRDYTAVSFDNDKLNKKLIKSAAAGLIRNLFEIGNNADTYYAVINTRRRVPDLHLHPLRRYGNDYVPKPQSWFRDIVPARRTLIVAANDYLLNIDVVSKPNWDKFLQLYRPLNGSYTKDISKYWQYVDYVVDGYVAGSELVKLDSTASIGALAASVTNFAVTDATGNTIEAYNKTGSNITLVYRKNGTIQLSNAVWDGSLGDAWDRGRWDRNAWDDDASEVVESMLLALRNNIFTDGDVGYFNLVFFALVKESLSQISSPDWVTKTTYLDVTQTSNNELIPVASYFNKTFNLVERYINEVKPYHSKIIDTNQFSKSVQDIAVAITEGIMLTITTASTGTDTTLALVQEGS